MRVILRVIRKKWVAKTSVYAPSLVQCTFSLPLIFSSNKFTCTLITGGFSVLKYNWPKQRCPQHMPACRSIRCIRCRGKNDCNRRHAQLPPFACPALLGGSSPAHCVLALDFVQQSWKPGPFLIVKIWVAIKSGKNDCNRRHAQLLPFACTNPDQI